MDAPETAERVEAGGTRVAVIGAGRMGMSVAQWLAFSGVPLTLCSRNEDSLQSFRRDVEKHFAGKVRRGRMSEAESRRRLESLRTVRSHGGYEGLKDAEFVIECVAERLAVKRALFQELGRADGERILCSNTSSLAVSEIARDAVHPERIVGTHFFQPVRFTSVVEVIPARETGSETVARVEKLLTSLGKTPLRVKDCPGFLVNRMLAAYLLAAVRMAREGIASRERIDRALRDWGMQLGPFEIMKVVGVDLVLTIARGLSAAYGERFRVDDLVEGIDPASWLEAAPAVAPSEDEGGCDETIVDRALLPLVEEARTCLREGIASPSDVERAAIACLRMPKGPLALARERGIEVSREASVSKGSRLEVEIAHQVAVVTLNNPPANSLTPGLMEDFLRLLDRGEIDSVRALVIVGAGRVFSAGVDPAELGALRSAEEAYLRSRNGQELLQRIERGDRPVIAAINGLCLGGGLELALACHIRFASDRARLGVPEVQLGIIPGLGGTQRLPRLVGLSRALDLVLTGHTIKAERAYEIGLVDRLVSRKEVLDEARAYARRLTEKDPSVVAAVLRTLRDGTRLPMEAGLELEAETFGRLAGARFGSLDPDGARAAVEWQFVDEHGGRHEHGKK